MQFPYALRVLPETVKSQWDEATFKEYRYLFPAEYRDNQEAFQAHVVDLMNRDVKIAYLKNLQGYLWKEGYRTGEIKAPLFPDVADALSKWHGQGIKLIVYSSGSVPAQKLLFKHTNAESSGMSEDLTMLISDWFDTTNAGLKTESSSYETIARKHPEFPVNRFLFLSDNVKEVDAAIHAGMRAVVVQRPGNADLSPDVYEKHDVVETFQSIEDDFAIKRLHALGKRTADEAVTELGESKGPDDDTAEVQGPDAKRLKTSENRQATMGKDADAKTTTNQDTDGAKEEPSRMDKLLAQAVGDAPPTPKEPVTIDQGAAERLETAEGSDF